MNLRQVCNVKLDLELSKMSTSKVSEALKSVYGPIDLQRRPSLEQLGLLQVVYYTTERTRHRYRKSTRQSLEMHTWKRNKVKNTSQKSLSQ